MESIIELRRLMPAIQSAILEGYGPQDLALFEEWMQHTSDGARVPWTELCEQFPVEVPDIVWFEPNDDELHDAQSLEGVTRVLRVCPTIQLRVAGTARRQDDPTLADRRAAAVCRALAEDLDPRTTRDPDSKELVPRLVPAGQVDAGPGRVEFEVTIGRLRTPAALRMRVTQVLLPHIRAAVLERTGGQDA